MMKLNASIANIPIPHYMRNLPISAKGFPIPWFVAKTDDGTYDIRIADGSKVPRAVRQKLCWLCGNTLGRRFCFVIGPMCAVNRVTSEPPCHPACAAYAVAACPFLTQPRMRRNEKDRPDEARDPAGYMIKRNPGVSLVWTAEHYTPFRAHAGSPGMLFRIGKPVRVEYFAEGRHATREEIMESMTSGMPLLRAKAELDGPGAIDALELQFREAVRLLPAA